MFIFFAIFGGQQFLSAGGFASWLNVAAELGHHRDPGRPADDRRRARPLGRLGPGGELDDHGHRVRVLGCARWALGIVVALGLGLVVGFLNGYLVTRTNVPSFVVTLATLFALAGLTLGLSR